MVPHDQSDLTVDYGKRRNTGTMANNLALKMDSHPEKERMFRHI